MGEKTSRFRFKNGQIEIEYKGPLEEANERYDNAFEWLTSRQTKRVMEKVKPEKAEEKKDKRGGPRRTLYSPKITELVEEGFFGNRKSLDEVIKGLVPKNVPTKGANARHVILNNLKRRINQKGKRLKGAKEENVWYFWID